jgi:hypothetical protein
MLGRYTIIFVWCHKSQLMDFVSRMIYTYTYIYIYNHSLDVGLEILRKSESSTPTNLLLCGGVGIAH